MVVKTPFQNKGYQSGRKNRATAITGNLFIKYEIKNNKIIVQGGQMILCQGTEFNEHQQKIFSITKGYRKLFSDNFKINFNNRDEKVLHLLNEQQLKWWNQELKSFKSLLSISRYLTGNNPTGSQKNKKNAEFILTDGNYKGKSFFNLLRIFTKNGTLKFSNFNYLNDDFETFDQFLDKLSKFSDKYKYVIRNFYSTNFLKFNINEMMKIVH